MAGNKYLLDTVIVVGYFNRELVIQARLAQQTVFVSSITIGELYFGAYNSQQAGTNIKNVRDFLAAVAVLECDFVTADHYGQIRVSLRRKGRPIPENDIWIAATAMQHDLILATRDAHFKEVDGLQLEMW